MGRRDKTSNDRAVSRHFLPWLVRWGLVVSVAACNQIVGITEPTLLDGMGGAGGELATSSSSSSNSTSGNSSSSSTSGSGTTSSSVSSSSSTSGGNMPCMKKPDCPQDDACTTWSCIAGMCVPTYANMTELVTTGTAGDCKATFCNGAGQTFEGNYDNDTPTDDGSPCTIEACNNGTPTATFAPVGTTCGAGVCNASGVCSTCGNNMKDGDETGVDCGGSVCKKCNGSACAMGTECKSGFCADGVCCDTACTGTCKSCNLVGNVGACSNIPLGSTDDAPACNGTSACNGNGSCKLKDGEPCMNDGECANGMCITFMGSKICAL